MKQAYILFLSLFIASYSQAQLVNIAGAPTRTFPCQQACDTVTASYFKPLRTNTYQASSIGFNPITLTAPTTISLQDDKFSGAIPIGFTFCFYGSTYSQVYVSANGHITFNPGYASGNCSFDTRQAIPFYSASYPDNAIFCPFNDGNTSIGGTISYKMVGTAPFRKFVVQYSNIPFFGTACTGSPATFQCVLSESTNDIEFFITNKSTCNADTSNYLNYATLGIQGPAAQNFLVVNNRNASVWSASNEGWKISPAGPPAYTLRWYVNNILSATNVPSIVVCNPFPKTVKAVLTLQCPARTIEDTIRISKMQAVIDSVVTINTSCKNTIDGSATIFASGGTPPYTYSVNGLPFTSSNTFGNLPWGSHFAQVKDANGCITTYSFNIGVSSTLGISISSVFDPFCPNNTGSINTAASGGVPPYSFIWNTTPIQTTSNVSGLGPGTYTVTVTDAQGCKETLTHTLTWDPLSLPTITDSVIKPVCGNSSGSIYLQASGTTAPYNYLWTTPSSVLQNLQNLPSGTYSAIITDANGCSKTYSNVLVDTLNMQLQLTNFANTTCGFNNGMGSVSATAGLPPYMYTWSNSATTFMTNTLSPGWQYITVSDANGCTRMDSVYIDSSQGINLQFLPADAYCDEDNGVINTIVSGATGPITYAWSNNQTTSYADSLAAGSYSLTITDSLGCIAMDSATIVNVGKPRLIVVDYIPPLCYGDSTGRLELSGLNGVPPYKYSLDGTNFSAVAIVPNFAAGSYTIYMRDANSCESDTTVFFTPPKEIIMASTSIDTLICYDDLSGSVTFTAQDGTAPYRWSRDNNSFSGINTFSGFGIGVNTIYVLDSNNCHNELFFEVPGPPTPIELIATVVDIPCYKSDIGSIDIEASGGWSNYNYTWQHDGSTSFSLSNLSPGKYQATVTDDRGCQKDTLMDLKQLYCCDCYFPNAFTPNADTKNDVFRAISPSTDITEYHLSVYNRWGNCIFKTTDLSGSWDGNIEGEPAPIGTYFYKCKMKCQNSKDDVFIGGDLILIR